ncbi:hypothetical protein BC828DRAFT_393137 [Blastocladiella britannica]|nr:hypothetical protein BC828DRAFT_393137 [Blastocladiella britannica]
MAHQAAVTGIEGDLSGAATTRLYRIQLQDEKIVVVQSIPTLASSSSATPNDSSLGTCYSAALAAVEAADADAQRVPCYLLIRTGTTPDDDAWLFVTYVPDGTHPQIKMRYAFSQNTVKKNLLAAFRITDSLFASTWNELTYKGYTEHVALQSVSALSADEKERALLETAVHDVTASIPMGLPGMAAAINGSLRTGSPHSSQSSLNRGSPSASSSSLAFPIDDKLRAAVADDLEIGGSVIAVVANETIVLHSTVAANADLATVIPADVPSYIVTRLDESTDAMTFCCPDTTRVKDRMIGSSARSSVLGFLDSGARRLGKRYEISEVEDLAPLAEMRTDAGIGASTGGDATTIVAAPAFQRPKPPGRPRKTVQ